MNETRNDLRNVFLDGTIQGRVADGNGRVVVRTHVQLVIILQKKRPLSSVEFRSLILRLDHVLVFSGSSFVLALFV